MPLPGSYLVLPPPGVSEYPCLDRESQSVCLTHARTQCEWEMQSSVPAFLTEKPGNPHGGHCSLKLSYLEIF